MLVPAAALLMENAARLSDPCGASMGHAYSCVPTRLTIFNGLFIERWMWVYCDPVNSIVSPGFALLIMFWMFVFVCIPISASFMVHVAADTGSLNATFMVIMLITIRGSSSHLLNLI